jgi:hypothetical protein
MRIAAVLFLALISLNVRADDIIGVDMTGYFVDPLSIWDILFSYDLTTGTISNLYVQQAPDCHGANPEVTYLTTLNGSNITLSGTETVAGCRTIEFSGVADVGHAVDNHVFGGAHARYVPSTNVPEPDTLALMVLGFAGLFVTARRSIKTPVYGA